MALETLSPDTEETPPIAVGKTAVPKGPYALPVGGVATGVDPGLLENMQKIIAEREAQRNNFLETLKDVTAWGAGGVQGPGEALRARDKQREEQDATTFGMKSQIAQYKAQQAMAQRAQQDVLASLDGSGAPGQGGAGGPNAQVDPAIAQQVRMLAATDPAAARKLLQDHLKKMSEIAAQARVNPEAYKKTIEVRTPTGKLDMVSLMDVLNSPQKFQPTKRGAAVVQSQTSGVSPAAPTAAAPAAAAPTAAAPTATGTFNQIKPIPPMPKSAPLAPPELKDTFPVVAGEEKGAMKMTPAAPAPVAAPAAPAPVAAPAPRAPITPVAQKTIPELRAEAEADAAFQKEAGVGAAKSINKQLEEFEANTSSTNVIEKRAANQRIIDLVMGSPNSVGLLEKPGMGAALATLAKNGLNTPSGAIGVQELEDALVKVMPGTDQKTINARNEIKQNLARGELEASKLAQGQGAVSDFERRLFAKVSGSVADTPELLIKRQMALVARENLNEKLGSLWNDQQQPGKAPNFAQFKTLPERKRLIAEYDKELRAILDKEIKVPKAETAKPAIPKYDAAKESRYQQWKQSQGIK